MEENWEEGVLCKKSNFFKNDSPLPSMELLDDND